MKITVPFLSLLLAFSLAACSGTTSTPAADDSSKEPNEQSEESLERGETSDDAPKDAPEDPSKEPQEEREGEDEEPQESAEESDAEIFQMGSTATLGEWEISVTDFAFTTTIDNGYGSFVPDDGSQYGVVHVTVTNTGKTAATFLSSFGINSSNTHAKILYADGYEFSPTTLLGYDGDMHDTSLNPLASKSGQIAFEMPESVVNSTEPLSVEFSTMLDDVTFALR